MKFRISKHFLRNQYISYENACELLNMDTLYDRREAKCLRFAKGCLTDKHMKNMFPLNMKRRNHEKFQVNHARTPRYKDSTIIYMQKLLNMDSEKNRKLKKSIDQACSREARLRNCSLSL